MSRIIRILGLAMLLTALLVVSISGTVLAAEGNEGELCPYGPLEYEHLGPGPYGAQTGK